MNRNRKRTRITLLIILLLGISIGFAALSTVLKINGTANITKNTWNIYWDPESVSVTQGSKSGTEPLVSNGEDGSTNTKVTWSTNLEIPGEFYEFTVDAVNAGTIDAMIEEIIPTVPTGMPNYISYTVTYADGITPLVNHSLSKGTKSGNTIIPTREKYKVRVEFKDTITPAQMDAIPDEGLDYDFGFEVKYVQATNDVANMQSWVLPEGRNKDNLQFGDELCYRGECFNFIAYDGNDVKMLAKWNLSVGANLIGEPTNRQDSEVRGAYEAFTVRGQVKFSDDYYWEGKFQSFPANIYDPVNYAGAPGSSNYSIAYYVEKYKTLLTLGGATIKEARLLTDAEATMPSIGCTHGTYGGACPDSFITKTSFWLGTARLDKFVYQIYGTSSGIGNYNSDYPENARWYGVRPLIVVEKSNLK